MKKKLTALVAAGLLGQTLWVGGAFAAYNPSNNLVVGLNLLPKVIQPSSALGDATFNLQESVHQTVTDLTGLSIDHSYAMVELNGVSLLAIDPPVALINKKK
ncbi:hypothetical protein [Cohnella sp. 56]|uniref:hypothetical protein n=1 Tax=Cohnella sp. 56 TaxID=3113722 RepID=UPI0030E84E46